MLVRLVEEDGSYIDETNVDKKPSVGETIDVGSAYTILEMPAPDGIAIKLGAQVLAVESA